MPLHQALTRFHDKVRVVLPRHEQGGGFAAQGYARSTGKVGADVSVDQAYADARHIGLVLIAVNPTRLGLKVRWEPSRGGRLMVTPPSMRRWQVA